MLIIGACTVGSLFFFPWAAIAFALAGVFVVWFFRDPERRDGAGETALIAPADGKLVEIADWDEPNHISGAARKFAIFMSLVDVHVNRSPCGARVEWVRHEPGKFMNALEGRAGLENERTMIALRDGEERPVLVQLVAGLIARRIVCPLQPGDAIGRGDRIGMIKFGSRVEVFIPRDGKFRVTARLGERVRAGVSVLGVWE